MLLLAVSPVVASYLGALLLLHYLSTLAGPHDFEHLRLRALLLPSRRGCLLVLVVILSGKHGVGPGSVAHDQALGDGSIAMPVGFVVAHLALRLRLYLFVNIDRHLIPPVLCPATCSATQALLRVIECSTESIVIDEFDIPQVLGRLG